MTFGRGKGPHSPRSRKAGTLASRRLLFKLIRCAGARGFFRWPWRRSVHLLPDLVGFLFRSMPLNARNGGGVEPFSDGRSNEKTSPGVLL